MTCPEIREAFSALYEDELSEPRRTAVARHLAACPACQHEWQQFQATVDAVRGLGPETPSPGFADRVMARIEGPSWWKRAVQSLVVPLPVKLPLEAAALVLVGLIGVWLFQRSPDTLGPPVRQAPSAPAMRSEAPRPDSPSAGGSRSAKPAKPERTGSAKKPEVATAPHEAPPTDTLGSAATPPASAPAPPGTALDQAAPPPAHLERREAVQAAKREGMAPKAKPAPSGATPTPPADDLLSQGRAAFTAGKYDEAVERLRAFVMAYPDDPRGRDARFWLAESYRKAGAYAEASRQYEEFLRHYPADEKAPAATYGLGEAQLRGDESKGCETLRGALRHYPHLPDAPSARDLVESRCP